MTPRIFKFLKQYSTDPFEVDKLIITSFVQFNRIKVNNNILIKSHLLSTDNNNFIIFFNILKGEVQSFEIEDLIRLFEFVISPAEKEVNGAVYTPSYIRDFIIENVLDHFDNIPLDNLVFADISCGCGGFFYTLALKIKERLGTTFENIYSNNILGVDIKEYSINRTKLLLSLLAVQQEEDIVSFDFNLFCANSLNFDFNSIEFIRNNNGVAAIIGNPPYVGSSKIDDESKALLNNWNVTKTGKTDLYIPFFQIGLELLSPNGILGYITVNNFYRSLNGRAIREYFSSNRFPLTMIDFGSEQVFKGRSTYTCICFIIKRNNGEIRYYRIKSKNISKVRDDDYILLGYNRLDDHKGWVLQNPTISKNIDRIEKTGKPLGKLFDIRNGFATLKNHIYLFNPLIEEGDKYCFTKDGVEYWIEKAICRDAIKPNILKNEDSISIQKEKLIFPYEVVNTTLFNTDGSLKIIDEVVLQNQYPLAYKYLVDYKEILNKRDKGTREYEKWYAYGRNQALTLYGYRLLFPYIADKPYFVLSNEQNLLFYNGYALISDNWEELQIIQKVLKSSLFWYYIKHTSKPYGSNYYALAKNYIKNFGVYNFNEDQRKFILQNENSEIINDFLLNLYKLKI